MLSKFSVKKPFTVLVAVIIIIVFGVVSFTRMTPDLFPSINMPYAIVMTTYPGASPEEVEAQVTEPLEEQLASLNNMKYIGSVSNESYSMIMMEFSDDVNMDALSVDIREKIELISGSWDEMVGDPLIMKINPDMMPVTVAAVSIKGMNETETTDFIQENLMSRLEGVDGVASVSATGMISEDIQVVLSQEKIDAINAKTSAAILKQFGAATGQINSGIKQAQDGQNQISSGKNALTEAQLQAASQMEAVRVQLKNSRQQLVEMKEIVVKIEAYEAAGNKPAAEALKQQLAAAGIDVSNLPSSKEIDAQIGAIDKALSDLNIQQAQTSATLGNQMSEMTGTSAVLQSTIAQLQAALGEVQSQQDAALSSANLTGILTMSNVSAILSAQNFSMPAGYVTDGSGQIMVSVGDKITDIDEMKNLVLLDMGIDGLAPVKLSDIADVTYADNAAETYAKLNGENGVLLTFTKQSGYATAEVADSIRDEFEEISGEYDIVTFSTLSDQGEYIHMVVNSVVQNLLLGALFAILILWFFLRDIRPTAITAISIPISVLFAIALMYFSGVTLNMISLSGLAVGVGMLVDNSIVVVENIYRLRALGYNRIQAAISGAAQMSGAITASTLTTVCVFVPIVFVDGLTRQIFTDMALTIGYSLMASLIIALTLVPAMARTFLVGETKNAVLSHESRILTKYREIIGYALDHKKLVLIAAVVLLIGSCGAGLARGFAYMPEMASPQISVTIQMPEDSELTETAEVSDAVTEAMLKHDEVETVGAMLASDTAGTLGISTGSAKDVTAVSMYVILKDGELDHVDEISKEIESFGKKYNCEVTALGSTDIMDMMGGSGVQIKIYSDDLETLRETAVKVTSELENVEGLTEITDLDENSTTKLQISIDKNKAMEHGLTVAQVYADIAGQLSSSKTATAITKNGTGTDVIVSGSEEEMMSRTDLENMEISLSSQSGASGKIKLTDIAEIKEGKALEVINHEGLKRVLTVGGVLEDGYNITHVTNDAKDAVEKLDLPKGTTVEFQGENETIMDAMKQMLLLLVLGMLLVYLIMVAQFQSLRSPFIVMFTIPLAFTGGMLALLISGYEVSIIAMVGFVMLVGIIVNNGIVLVDTINRFRLEEEMERREAIIEAGVVRIRPVLMTATTTVLGLIPMALGFGEGAEMVQPVAIVSIGGLLYATVMTLVVVPVMYSLLSKKHMVKIKKEDMEVVDA